MAGKSTPAVKAITLFVFFARAALVTGVMPCGSMIPEHRLHDADVRTQSVPAAAANAKQKASAAYGRLALSFEENRGQAQTGVDFAARGPGYTLGLSPTEAAFALNRQSSPNDTAGLSSIQEEKPAQIDGAGEVARSKIAATILRMKLVGANRTANVEGRDELEGKVNYFRGNDPAKWQTGVSTFAKVRYIDVYPGIDIEYYGNQKQLEYDFVIAPGRDPSAIALEFAGADGFEVETATGDLLVRVNEQTIRQHAPVTYQQTASGERSEIESRYVLKEDGRIGFEVEAYDQSALLVIDPVFQYSTFLGGSGTDIGVDIAVDFDGNAYVVGRTNSANFPTVNPVDASHNSDFDVFVTKMNASGTACIYSTYLGGSGLDEAVSIAVDSAGNAFLTGDTKSTNFPTVNPIDGTANGDADAFVTKINAAGTALIYSTYLGGSGLEIGYGVAVDSPGNAYLTGVVRSPNFPTVNPIDGTLGGGQDAFVTKINPAGTALVYSTYLGGSNGGGVPIPAYDYGFSIALDSANNVYVTGHTNASDFPTVNPIQPIKSNSPSSTLSDAFVSKINPAGTAFVYSTYLGGNSEDIARGIAVDSAGNAYVAGDTQSSNFPTVNPINTDGASTDAFVTKINATGTALVYSTYIAAESVEIATAIAVDSAGNAYVAGLTFSPGFPTVNPIAGTHDDGVNGVDDAFVVKINAAGSALVYSSSFGGADDDEAYSIAADSAGNAYVTGFTRSGCFPATVGAFDTTHNGGAPDPNANGTGGADVFISKISETAPPSTLTPPGPIVQFSAANYSVQEDCTSVTITLNRVGDLSSAASVGYFTSNGTASDRGDYITAAGDLQFAAGEASKTFVVLINEDSYVEGPETLNLNLSGVSCSGTQVNATVTILDDASEPATNVIDDPSNYVCQHYHDLLNRQPDQSGWDFWTSQITSCNSDQTCIEARRINVSASFFLSIEFQNTGYLVERSFKAAYADVAGNSTSGSAHQLPVPTVRFTEFLSDTQQITKGVVVLQPGWEQVLETNKQAFFAELVQRSRFTTALPTTMTPAEFVDRLNQNAGNVLSASERTTAINLFSGAGNTTNVTARAQALRQVAEDQDLQAAEFNRAFVLMQYVGYLRRNPNDPQDTDYSGYDFWLTKLNQFNGNYINAEMVKAFITSGEYRQRFGP